MQNLVDVGGREGSLHRGEFYVTFCVPSIVYGSKRVFPRKVGPFAGLDDKK